MHFLSAALGNSANESNLRENKPLSNVTACPRRQRKCKSFGGGCHSNRSSSACLSVYLEIVDNRESATLTFYYRTGQKLSFNSLRNHILSKPLSEQTETATVTRMCTTKGFRANCGSELSRANDFTRFFNIH